MADQNQQDDLASLENSTTVVEPSNGPVAAPNQSPVTTNTPKPQNPITQWLAGHTNVYFIVFLILVVGSIIASIIFYRQANNNTSSDVLSQSLSQSTLDQLSTSDVNVGEPKHTLSVESNTVFNGAVLVRSDLQIAGSLQVGSDLAIAGLRVTGNSTFDDVQITRSFSATGDGTFAGQLNVQKSLTVTGNGSFTGSLSAGSLTVGTLQLSDDLILTHHLTAGGPTPARSNGPALGSGGTVSISGSDTSGTVTINTGGSPVAGCFVTITFTTKFNNTPRLSLTPVGSTAAGLTYYVNRSTTDFSVCTASVPPAASQIVFDYIALD